MFRMVVAALCGLMLWGLASASSAQSASQFCTGGPAEGGSRLCTGARSMSAALVDPRASSVTSVAGSRLDRQRARNGVYTQQPNMNQIMATTQSEMNTANVECRVVDAALLGYNADQQGVYEVACGSGMGYVVAAASPPAVTDCVTLAGRSEALRGQDPAAPAALICKLVGNQNTSRMVAHYGQEAGVGCAIDAAAMVGTSVAGNAVYEIGCPGVEGYWVEKASTGWIVTPCLKVASTGAACRFTTHDESALSAKAWLAGTAASGCDVTEVRYMGANAAGAFYETKCGAGGGFVARLNDAMAVQQVYSCDQAASIGGGCKLAEIAANRQ